MGDQDGDRDPPIRNIGSRTSQSSSYDRDQEGHELRMAMGSSNIPGRNLSLRTISTAEENRPAINSQSQSHRELRVLHAPPPSLSSSTSSFAEMESVSMSAPSTISWEPRGGPGQPSAMACPHSSRTRGVSETRDQNQKRRQKKRVVMYNARRNLE